VNLNAVRAADELEGVLKPMFAAAAERRYVAQRIFDRLPAQNGADAIDDVDARAAIRVPAAEVARRADLETVRERARAIVAAAAALGLVLVFLHAMAYRRLSEHLDEYVSVKAEIAPDSTVLPLSFVDDPRRLRDPSLSGFKIRPFEHALGYLAVSRPLVNLAEYQADQGYFPIRYRDDVDPYRVLVPEEGLVEEALERIDWRAYERRGGRVDYVLLWGRSATEPWPGQAAFDARLEEDYELVFTSQPLGLGELYRRRPAP
jgi:hypothetical protein